jgi:hypothetical protein
MVRSAHRVHSAPRIRSTTRIPRTYCQPGLDGERHHVHHQQVDDCASLGQCTATRGDRQAKRQRNAHADQHRGQRAGQCVFGPAEYLGQKQRRNRSEKTDPRGDTRRPKTCRTLQLERQQPHRGIRGRDDQQQAAKPSGQTRRKCVPKALCDTTIHRSYFPFSPQGRPRSNDGPRSNDRYCRIGTSFHRLAAASCVSNATSPAIRPGRIRAA